MRVVLQRVTQGSVKVNDEIVGQIGKGLVCLVGIGQDDTIEDVEWCTRKILNVCLWPNEDKKPWKTCILDNEYEVLLISQFTLHGYFKGNKPDFHLSMSPGPAKELFDQFVRKVEEEMKSEERVQKGVFGAYMDVSLTNDGPVTMSIDSKRKNER